MIQAGLTFGQTMLVVLVLIAVLGISILVNYIIEKRGRRK